MPTTLTAAERAQLRRDFSSQQGGAVNWLKEEINAAFDALDAKYEDEWRAEGSTAIDNATTFNFTNAQKKKIGKFWFRKKFDKE